MKIMHIADLHLGAFPGPDFNGENARFKDLQAGLVSLAKQAAIQQPDLVIIAGDLFHQAKVWSDRGLREQAVMVHFLRSMLETAPVFVLRGTPNHDGYEQFETLKTTFEGEQDLVFAMDNGLFDMTTRNGQKVYLAALPGFHRSLFLGEPAEGESEGEYYTERVNEAIGQLNAICPKDGSPRILVGHYTVEHSQTESGQTTFFSQTEPVVRLRDLAATSFDLMCFGHIHKPQQLKDPRGFYCGAMARLNFNDESQVRGFYMHEVQPGLPVQSVFVEMDCREMCTIELNDAQITAVIEGKLDVSSLANVEGKIVRVRYSCTDAHNKALQTAVIERQLMQASAFWVQEITPVDIQTTVGKAVSLSSQTPVVNLGMYLDSKGVDDQTTQRLSQLAVPMVQDVQDVQVQRQMKGLFEPVEIKVHNYRNYADASFDYGTIQFCTVNGENGVGKSSLFMDAVVDALYELPREGDLAGWIRNDPSVKSGSIRFTFRLGDDLFRVTRSRRKTGSPTLKLEQKKDDVWTDISKDRVRDTQDEIESVLGMDALTFKSCVFIMQDQYGLFLSADPSERMDILGNLLGLGVYDELESSVAEKLTEVNREVRELNARMDQMMKNLPDGEKLQDEYTKVSTRLADLERQQQEAQEQLKALQAQHAVAVSARDRVARLNQEQQQAVAQKETWQKQSDEQTGLIRQLEAQLAREPEIRQGKERYEALLGQERELMVDKTRMQGLHDQITAAQRDVQSRAKAVSDQQVLIKSLTQKKAALDQELAGASQLEQAVAEDKQLETQQQGLYGIQTANQAKTADMFRLQQEMSAEENGVRQQVQQLTMQIQAAEKQAELLENSGCLDAGRASCRFLKDAQAAKASIPGLKAQVEQIQKAYDAWMVSKKAELDTVQAGIVDVSAQMQQIQSRRAALKVSVEAYNALGQKRGQRDQMVRQLDDAVKAVGPLQQAEQEAQKVFADLQVQLVQYDGLEDRYQVLAGQLLSEKHWADEFADLSSIGVKLTGAKTRVQDLTAMMAQLDQSMALRAEEIAREQQAVRGLLQLQTQMDTQQRAVQDLAGRIRQDAEWKGQLSTELDQFHKAQAEIDQFRQTLAAKAQLAADYKVLKQAFSSEGIRHQIIETALPTFETEASAILGQMSGGQMRVEFVTKYELKSSKGKEVPTLDVIIDDIVTGKLPYKSRSGGERVKAALSVILALAEIKSASAGVQLGFLGIDEPPYLDAQGAQAYCDALEAIQVRYPDMKVMAITHDPSMKGRFPQSVNVVKTPQGSMVLKN